VIRARGQNRCPGPRATVRGEAGQSLVEAIVALGIFALLLTVIAVVAGTVLTTVATSVRQGQASSANQVNLTYISGLLRDAVSPANAAAAAGTPTQPSTYCWGGVSPSDPTGPTESTSEADTLSVVVAHDFDVVLCAYPSKNPSAKPQVFEAGVAPATCSTGQRGSSCTVEVVDWGATCNPGTYSTCKLVGTHPVSTTGCRPGDLAACPVSGTGGPRVVFSMPHISCGAYCQGTTGHAIDNGSATVAVACTDTGATCATGSTPPIFEYFGQAMGEYKSGATTTLGSAFNTLQETKTGAPGPTLDLSEQHQVAPGSATAAKRVAATDLSEIQQVVFTASELNASMSTDSEQVHLVNQSTAGYSANCLQAAMLATGPVAYYALDTAANPSTTVTDRSGNKNTGHAYAPGGWDQPIGGRGPDPSCSSGARGMEFTGTTHVTTTTATEANKALIDWNPGTSSLTVAGWFEETSAPGSTGSVVVASNDPTVDNLGFEIEVTASGGAFVVGNGTTAGTAAWTAPLTAPLRTSTWYFYVGTYGSTRVNAYLDGRLVASSPWKGTGKGGVWKNGSSSTCSATGATMPIAIGWDPCSEKSGFSGYLADVAIYTTAMSAGGVESVYRAAGDDTTCLIAPMLANIATLPSTVSHPTTPTKKTALYPLTGSIGTGTVTDDGPYKHTATVSNATPTTTPGDGPTSCDGGTTPSMGFNGTSTEVTLPTAPFGKSSDFGPTGLTVEAWAKFHTTATGGPVTIAANARTTTPSHHVGFDPQVNSGRSSGFFAVGNGTDEGCAYWSGAPSDPGGSTGLSATRWYFFVETYDGTSVRAYIDGQLMGTLNVDQENSATCTSASPPSAFTGGPIAVASTGTTSGCVSLDKGQMAVGFNPCVGGDFFKGNLADVAVFPIGLSGEVIEQQFKEATT